MLSPVRQEVLHLYGDLATKQAPTIYTEHNM